MNSAQGCELVALPVCGQRKSTLVGRLLANGYRQAATELAFVAGSSKRYRFTLAHVGANRPSNFEIARQPPVPA